MAQTKLNAADLLKTGSVGRTHLNTTQAGSAVIARLNTGIGVTMSSTGVDVGTGDVTVSATGQVPASGFGMGSTNTPGVTSKYSSYLYAPIYWNSVKWLPMGPAPRAAAIIAAGIIDGGYSVDCGKITDATGDPTELGTINGAVLMYLDLGSIT